jgi:pimeloyl-ACP methyl ester carboxylesterase
MSDFSAEIVQTPRLAMNVWTSGPADGTPVLLVHGNITTGGFWKYVAEALPDDVRVIAPDLRSFGDTEALPVDATQGLREMSDDLHGLLEVLGLTGRRSVHAAGWSMGGGVLEQYLLDHPDDLASVTLIAPLSPYGFGGTKGVDGEPVSADHAGTGGGTAAPEFVRRLAERDAGEDDPQSAPRTVLLTFFGPGANADNVDADFLVAELLKTTVGDDHYPGDLVPSDNWPNVAPGERGVLNSMSPKWFDTSALGEVRDGVPITWIRGTADQVVSDRSMFDLATLGELGAVPGWPGAEVMPSQPMESQLRAVLDRYAAGGGSYEEVVLEGVTHGIPLEVPQRVADEIVKHLR